VRADIDELRPEEVDIIIQAAERNYGPIEMVICCAAISKPALFLQSDYKSYMNHMNVNYLGVLKMVLPIAKRMVYTKTQGRIVIVGDPLTSHYNVPGMSPYACSKAALEQLAYSIKTELEPQDIKVHYYLPPPMDSVLYGMQRKNYPLITRCLMKNYAPLTSDYGAQTLLRGISMGQFVIPGTYTAALMHSIRGTHHNYITQLLLAPFALALR